jgi:hypothetical protein
MVESVTLPEQVVDESVVLGIDPEAEIVIAFVPSLLWVIVLVILTAGVQSSSVMLRYWLARLGVPSKFIIKFPVPEVANPLLVRL